MKCYECGGKYVKLSGSLEMTDDHIGTYVVQNVEYYKCNSCPDFMFPAETSRYLDEKREELKIELIENLPFNDFITAPEACRILGISRQAFHKHRRIRKGFIYRAKTGGITLYSKRSVLLFRSNDDGRFPLNESCATEPSLESNYDTTVPVHIKDESIYDEDNVVIFEGEFDTKNQRRKLYG